MKRRDFLSKSLAIAGATGLAGLEAFWPQNAHAAATGQLVFVFLRGGADALSLFPPAAGVSLTALNGFRPTTKVTGALPYSTYLTMHPLMAPLMNDATVKARANVIVNAGSLNETRSHFEQMARIEGGNMTAFTTNGFLARANAALGNPATFSIASSVTNALRGTQAVVLQDPAKLQPNYTFSNWRMPVTRTQRLGMYKGGDATINANAVTAQSQFDLLDDTPVTLASLVAARAYLNTPFGQRLATAGAMLGSVAKPALIAVDAEHVWDTHTAQGTNTQGAADFGNKVNDIARNLLAFKNDLVARSKWATTTVVVMSEFGRTVKENADSGTDHGRGGMMLIFGGGVRATAASAFNQWVIPTSADSSTALAMSRDYRIVLAEILQKKVGLPAASIPTVFPGLTTTPAFLNVTI